MTVLDLDRFRKGEVRQKTGLAIVNPYGGLWTDEIFDSAEDARSSPTSRHRKSGSGLTICALRKESNQ